MYGGLANAHTVFRVITPEGDRPYRTTHDLQMMGLQRLLLAKRSWVIEKYHQGANHFVALSAARPVPLRLNAILYRVGFYK